MKMMRSTSKMSQSGVMLMLEIMPPLRPRPPISVPPAISAPAHADDGDVAAQVGAGDVGIAEAGLGDAALALELLPGREDQVHDGLGVLFDMDRILREDVVRGDRDEDTDGGGDQGLADGAHDVLHAACLGLAELHEGLDHAEHGAEQTDERRVVPDGAEEDEALLEPRTTLPEGRGE